jgi:heptosyltransferase-2
MENQAKPLLVRMPNWIGDCMMALPALHYLEKHGSELTLVGKTWLADLFADAWPVITLQPDKNTLINSLKSHPASEMLLLTNSFSSAWLAKKSKKKSIGYKGDYRNLLLHKKFSHYANLHEANHFLKLAQLYLNGILNSEPLKAYSLPNKASRMLTETKAVLLNQYDFLNEPFILICPFAAGTNKAGESKVWPYWETLLSALNEKFPNFNLVYCPGPNEKIEADTTSITNLFSLEHLSLQEYLAVMALAKIVLGNDTGPMHMAACVNPQSYTLFGATDPNRTAPLHGHTFGKHGQWPELNEVLSVLTGFKA